MLPRAQVYKRSADGVKRSSRFGEALLDSVPGLDGAPIPARCEILLHFFRGDPSRAMPEPLTGVGGPPVGNSRGGAGGAERTWEEDVSRALHELADGIHVSAATPLRVTTANILAKLDALNLRTASVRVFLLCSLRHAHSCR